MKYRIEKDLIGSKEIDDSKYYGINTVRALENFNLCNKTINIDFVREIALVKKAAAITNMKLGNLEEKKAEAIIKASEEVIEGNFDDQFKISAFQGGAGTSTNMNVNEVIANRAIELMGGNKGDYSIIHPLNDVNMSQSTNDVCPTALRIATIKKVKTVIKELQKLKEAFNEKEDQFSEIYRLGRTQLMDAVPMTVGQGFGAYSKVLERDLYRIRKTEENLKDINLGGTAIGTGLNATDRYIFIVADTLRHLTKLDINRANSLVDGTQNTDSFVEVSSALKTCAANLIKISNDLRILNSGPRGGFGEIALPARQAGSSIMPGKVNPVIPEMIGQISMRIIANDTAITLASSSGQLELNAFIPLIAESLLESLDLLEKASVLFREKCVDGILVNEARCLENLEKSTALVTALVPHIGYDRACELAKKALKEDKSMREILYAEGLYSKEQVDFMLDPSQLIKPASFEGEVRVVS
ncbi:aspartate ammonia-lyase [Clostridium manihotivorum]|uniref:aspartate ammonia-lyase n=1 Tax=Clostridium manihotivorum TaxID=2320868 RepID=A0A410DP62_9CLOT|nr:aspartate ammonia-lyase [Clostridium manihotivorum]QAA30872.1 aspartate ammonia-lyase [Clostridium manihotivorum]